MTGIRLDQLMDVYIDTGLTGAFDVLDQAGVACHFFHVSRQPAATSQDRAELAALRNLHYSADYDLPDHAQVEATSGPDTGLRFNPVYGTEGAIQPFSTIIQRRIDAIRAG